MHQAEYLYRVIAKTTLDVKRPFLELSGLRGRNRKNFLSIYLASWRNIKSFFYSQSLKQITNPNDPHKEVKSKPEM